FILLSFPQHLTTTSGISTLSLHDALPICHIRRDFVRVHRNAHCKHKLFLQGDRLCQLSRFTMLVRRHSYRRPRTLCRRSYTTFRSEEHTSELQSRFDLVCRLLLEKKKRTI